MKPIALFDLDGVLADYDGGLREYLEKMYSSQEVIYNNLWNAPDHIRARVDAIKRMPGWWQGLDILPAGFEILDLALELGFEVRVLTAGPKKLPLAWKEKVEWCQAHLPVDVQVTITRDKSTVYGRVLVDDWPGYMEPWLKNRPRGLGIMPLTKYNRDCTHPNLVHYDDESASLEIVREKLIQVRDRKDGQSL